MGNELNCSPAVKNRLECLERGFQHNRLENQPVSKNDQAFLRFLVRAGLPADEIIDRAQELCRS